MTSPFTRLLNTNCVPSGLIRSEISAYLVEPQETLKSLNADVSKLEEQLTIIRRKRDDLNQFIYSHRRLPDNLLVEIFLRCLPHTHNPVMNTRESPLLLGRVCSRWRSIVYRTPLLWSSLHIPCPIPPSIHMANNIWLKFESKLALHTSAVKAWLTRSGSSPLTLSFRPKESHIVLYDLCVKPYLDILLEFTDRWFDIQMTVLPGDHSAKLASIPPSSLPILTHLDLQFRTQSLPDTAVPWFSSELLTAATLTTLRIIHYPHDAHAIQVGANWSNLTRLYVNDRRQRLSLKDTFHLLFHSPKLQFCSLRITDTHDARINSATPLVFPDLHTLVMAESVWCISTLLDLLKFPSLHSLSYHTSFTPIPNRPSPLIALIAQSGCNSSLTHLIADMFDFNLESLLLCISLTPHLTHYTNHPSSPPGQTGNQLVSKTSLPVSTRLGKSLLNILTPGYLDDNLRWPNLQHIELEEATYIPDADFFSFIHSRMSTSFTSSLEPHLQSIHVRFLNGQTTDHLLSLQKYIEEQGLKVHLIYPYRGSLVAGKFLAEAGLVKSDARGRVEDDFTVY